MKIIHVFAAAALLLFTFYVSAEYINVKDVPAVSAQAIYSAPPICIISGDDYVCSNSSGNIYTAPPGMDTYLWSITGNGTIQGSITSQSVSVTAGNYLNSYTVSVIISDITGADTCMKTSDIILFTPTGTITANPNPVCFGVTLTLSIPSATSSTVTWAGAGITNTSGTFIGSNNVTTALPPSPGKHIYSVSITTDPLFGGCTYIDSIDVNVDTASIVDAGPDQTICANDTIYLNATLSGVATNLVWQLNMDFGTFIGSDTDPNAKFVLNATGKMLSSLKFGVKSNDPGGVCQGGLDTVEIFIDEAAVVNAGMDTTVCGSTISVPLQGSISGVATGAVWSTTGSGSFTPNDSALNASYVLSAADRTSDSVFIYLTSKNDPVGLCGFGKDTMKLQIDSASIVDAGPDQTICANDTIYLHATLSGLATNIVWQLNMDFGTFIGSDTDPNAKFVLNATGKMLSSLKFGVMSNDPGGNVCQGGRDTVEIFIDEAAVVNAGMDTTVCGSTISVPLHGSISGAASGAVWSSTGTGSFTPNDSALNASYVLSAADRTSDSVFIYLTSKNDPVGLCGFGKDTMKLQIDSASIVDAGPDQTICANDTIFLHATLSGLATNIVWQLNMAFGTFIGSDTDPNAKYVLNATGKMLSSLKFGVMSNDPGGNVCQGGLDTVEIFIEKCCPAINVIYIDSAIAVSGSGGSWASPLKYLQDGLALAIQCNIDTIKVAQGTYYPDDGLTNNDRTLSFNIPDSTVVLGGFGHGADSVNRDWQCNKTILCGNIDQNGTSNNNSYHVVTTTNVSEATIVDGFCITGGNADGIFPHSAGGGWINDGSGTGNRSNPILRNLLIIGNSAKEGGGIYNYGFEGTSSPILTNVVISGNDALIGGGMSNDGENGTSSPILTNAVISGNIASSSFGGGMFNDGKYGTSSPILTNVVISGNFAIAGGGIYNTGFMGTSNPIITNCVLWNNAASVVDSIISQTGASSTTITYSIIQSGTLDVGTTLGIGNKPQGTDPLFINAPAAGLSTAGDFHVMSGSPAIDMGDNSAPNIYTTDLDGKERIINSIVDIGAYEFGKFIGCNLYTDVVYVDSSATGANNGTSWADAFNDLQDALTIVRAGCVDTVKVAQGTYYPSDTIFDHCGAYISLPDKTLSFNVPDSAVLLGGYLSGGGDVRDWYCNKTILCGDIDRNNVADINNSIHVVVTDHVDSSTVIDGFNIRGGYAHESYTVYPDYVGAGWYDIGSGDDKGSFPRIINCIISGNYANGGGGIFCDGTKGGNSSPTLIQSIISGNVGNANGGGMFNDGNEGTSSPKLFNCVVAGNLVYYFDGAAMYNSGINQGTSQPYITNSIFWNNQAYQNGGVPISNVFHNNAAQPIVGFSILQGISLNDATTVTTGSGNVDALNNKFVDPLFYYSPVLNDPPATTAGDFHTAPSSPAVDMGQNGVINLAADLGGNVRVLNGTIDIGAFEVGELIDCDIYTTLGVIYVDSSATGSNDGTSWTNAFADLQDALAVVRKGCIDTIRVAQGTYYPSNSFYAYDPCTGALINAYPADRSISFNIPDSVILLGGHGGLQAGLDSNSRDWECNKTILCGDIDHNGDTMNNSYHVVVTINVDSTTVVDGFCITGGNANGTGSNNLGGGWFNDGSGGGNSSNPTVINCKITGNHASRFGGGMNNNGLTNGNSSPTLINCIISGNSSLAGGGGINNNGFGGNSSPLLTNCLIVGNFSNGSGGGIVNFGSNGGNSSPVLTNCVVSGNFADIAGGALNNNGTNGNSTPILINCILWNNESPSDSIISENNSTTTILFSIIQAGTLDLETDISDASNKLQGTNPLFVSAPIASAAPTTAGDFHVKYLSPAIDMGDDMANNELTDLDGLPRKFNTIDIGAYEYQSTDCALYTSNTLYVDSSLTTGAHDGTTWMNAFTCLQDALEVAQLCAVIDTIKVAEGTYFPSKPDTIFECSVPTTIIPISRSDFFFLPDGITILGGYPNCIAGVVDPPRDPHCNPTILSGDINHDGDSTGNTYNVIKTIDYSDTITFDGFIVEHGNAIPNGEEGGAWWDSSGVDIAKLYIRNTEFRSNYAVLGGALYTGGRKDLCIDHTIFHQNTAQHRGGAFYIAPPFNEPIARILMSQVLMYDNKATTNGGAIGLTTTDGILLNIINATLTNNSPDAMNNNSGGDISIYNSVIWNNGITQFTGPELPTVFNSIVQGGFTGTNIKDLDPLFIDPVSNFRLTASSPAIDMGDNSVVNDSTDLDGLPRIVASTVDMGAYENLLICTPDTIYVNADGTVPALPLESIIGAPLTPECMLVINGIEVTEAIPFDCDDLGANPLDILIIKPNCDVPDTLYMCTKIVTVLDTFEKVLNGSDQVNVSLDETCMKLITADDVLKNVLGCRNAFEVTLTYPFGTNTFSPANKVDRSHLGYCLVYSVKDVLTGNSTWGKLCVEDKKGPDLACQADTVTCFEIAQLPQGSYTVKDNCASSETKVLVASEQFIDYGCDSFYQGKVIRHLVASDPWGNSVECEKEFYIKRIELDSVVCPRDTGIDCSLETGTSFKDPSRSGYPKIKTKNGLISLWPNNAACKLTLSPPIDEWYPICGAGYKIRRTWRITDWCTGEEKLCYQWIEVVDKTAPVASNKTLPLVYSDPHDCGQFVDIDTLAVSDCSKVTQNYSITYFQEGIPKVIQGVLPAKHIWLPVGLDTVKVFLVDACKNTSKARILIPVIDNTPPTPICDEFTQVTVDPASCWAAIAAKDLDNGSRDNCCDVLHFAAAHMDSITFWRNHWNRTLEAEVGKEAFWKSKPLYDTLIEDWINCYVFSDTVNFDDCGSNQVVMRVYEACGIPKYDPHVFPCSPHAWFCYNTYIYLAEFNYNWFDANGAKSCKYRPTLTSLEKMELRYASYYSKGYLEPKFAGAAQLDYCNVPFYFPSLLTGTNYSNPPGSYCSDRLYSDCMVNVLVDDKQAPVAYGLKDITIYCDGAPEWSRYKYCGDDADHYRSSTWPGELKDKKGVIHGYYGGSDFLGIHVNEDDHADPQACRESHGWAPIYCKDWLLLDSFDQAGHQDYASYFDKLLMFDKKTKQTAELKDNEFSITDNCLLDKTSLLVSNAGTINGCGEGWISRTWTMKDKCGNEVTATQKIYVKHRSDFEVIFPEDKVVTCDFLNRTDTSALGAGKPSISDDECEQVGVQYKDEIFTVEDSACYKIVRTWTLIDWCIYDPNQHNHHPDVIVDDRLRANSTNRSCVFRNIKDNGDGYMQYVQVIKVIDEIAPVFSCSDNTTCITAGCDATVNLPVSASDNCTDANDIRIRAEITKPDATVESRTNITAITGKFTQGVYKVKLVANDKCGNETTCNMTITVKDCKKPTPYCIDGLATVIMPNSGTVEIWAKDFNVASEDNCTAKDALRYSFGPDATNPNRVITCADIRNGREELLVVDIYVHDLADNKDLCKVSLKIQDNSSAEYPSGGCRDTTSALATITGKLATEEQEGVENARVEIRSSLSPSVNYMSKQDGSYTFKEMPMVGTYTLHALRDDEPMNGVSTLDLVAIQKHILGTEKLKSAYKMIAADVNNDKDISAIDLIELRKLILGVYEKLPENTSWKFVPKSYVFNDINNPWSYPTQEALTEMNDQMVKDFVGIKVGDVNASAVPHSLMGTEVRSTETGLIFEVEDRLFRAGESVKVEFRSPNFAGVSGFQGTMSMYNVPFTMYNVEAGVLSMTEKNIGNRWANEGLITMSWNEKTGIDVESDKVLFTMTFKAEKDGKLSDVMRIGSQRTKAESYEGKGELGNLSIRFTKNGKEISGTNTLYQNYPNPFDQRTVIGLNLAQSTEGILKITDVTGRTIKSIFREWNKGYNEIWLDKRDIKASGILFYTFESEEFKATKRMMLLQ